MAPKDDPELRGPAHLTPPRASVVRLNRRVLYVAGSVLVVAVLAGLVALRAQGSRLEQDARAPQTSQLTVRPGERWFDKVPDREPSAPTAGTTLPPASPATPPRPPAAPAAKTLSDAARGPAARACDARRHGSAHRGSGLRGALRRAERHGGPGPGLQATQSPAASIVPAAALATAQAAAGGPPPAPRQPAASPDRPEVLPAVVRGPVSPYEVKVGTIIPAVLLTGLNSDLPGQLIAQVRESVFDTETGQHLLVPQGARLIGLYDHQVVYGPERVLVTWKRILVPNGASLSLKDGMPGMDAAGAAGFNDRSASSVTRSCSRSLARACSSVRFRTLAGASPGRPPAMYSVPPWASSSARPRAS